MSDWTPSNPTTTTRIAKTLRVFDPPMCCSTGTCGPEPDPALARFAADLQWAVSQGARVERFSLAREPEVFARTPAVAEAFRRLSIAALPLVLLGDRVVAEGCYPSRAALAASLGLGLPRGDSSRLAIVTGPGCVPGSGCCG